MTRFIRLLSDNGGKVLSGTLIITMYVTVISAGWFLSYIPAYAGDVTNFKDTLTSSAPSSPSNHTITFTVSNTIAAQGSISVRFDVGSAGFSLTGLTEDDVDVASGSGEYETAASASGQVLGISFDTTNDELEIKLGGGGGGAGNNIEAGEVLTIEIGTNATAFGTGTEQIDNPSASGSKAIDATTYDPTGTVLDYGRTFVSIQSQVTLNAVVAANFTFTIDGMTTSEAIDSQAVASNSDDFYVGFGTLTAGTPILMGSSLSVSTNAANGFVVTVQQNHNLLASSGADIDCFQDGTCTGATSTDWAAPAGTLGSEGTYGHFGLTTEDDATISKNTSVSSTTNGDFIGMNSQTPYTIWSNSGPADGETQDIGHIDVGYRIEITALQEAGRYQNRLMYIATPTF